jgi:hypothetical protein
MIYHQLIAVFDPTYDSWMRAILVCMKGGEMYYGVLVGHHVRHIAHVLMSVSTAQIVQTRAYVEILTPFVFSIN